MLGIIFRQVGLVPRDVFPQMDQENQGKIGMNKNPMPDTPALIERLERYW